MKKMLFLYNPNAGRGLIKSKLADILDIFVKAGFDPDILGTSRMYAAIKKFKKEAASPEGLRETSSKTREQRMAQFAKAEYDKKHTKVALRELQKKVVHLEQQLEFLKKIHFPEE